jgi:hypothetical protein
LGEICVRAKAKENAGSLCLLSSQLSDGLTHGEYSLNVLSATAATDHMLAEQMNRLPEGGTYSVVSNVGSGLKNQLQRLDSESKLAVVDRGVEIKRIFVIGDRQAHRQTTGEAISQVLGDHLKKAKEWKGSGSYQVKLLDQPALDTLLEKLSDSEAAEFIFEHHFGIFARREEELCIRVEVRRSDLSDLRVRGLPETSEEICYFNDVWRALPALTPEIIDAAVVGWQADRVQRLRSSDERIGGALAMKEGTA